MFTLKKLPALLALAGLGAATPSFAHIAFYDMNQGQVIESLTPAGKVIAGNNLPLSNPAHWTPAYQNSTDGGIWTSLGGSYASGTWGYEVIAGNMTSSSWTDATRTAVPDTNPGGAPYYALGDSHEAGFANFHLGGTSKVTITLSDAYAGSGYGVNPSFSLYRGVIVYDAHDSAAVDPLNPTSGVPPTKVQNQKDTGGVVDSQGITSVFRDTTTPPGVSYTGQFNALGSWSQGSDGGDWSAVEFIQAVTGKIDVTGGWAGNSNSNTLEIVLGAGDYMIAFGGNATPLSYAVPQSGNAFGGVASELDLTLSLQVAAVPEPETWALLAAGLGLVTVASRRRARR